MQLSLNSSNGFLERLRSGGIEEEDDEQTRLNKTLLFFATGLVCLTSILWLLIYWILGPKLSASLPFLYQLLLTANLLIYIGTRNFNVFRVTQLGLFLFTPFVMQWSIGNFINSSGIALWALLAPFGAILCIGIKDSLPWFFAWVVLMLFSGAADFMLVGQPGVEHTQVPPHTMVTFFTLNFVAVASIIFTLLRYSTIEKEGFRSRLQKEHLLVQDAHARSEALLLNILPAPVAERLKATDQTIADGFQNVTVMFADISRFTEMAANLPPTEVFSTLNRIFSAFDEMAERHGLEKIKTIGDAYMVAGGLNLETQHYTRAVASLALEMRALLQHDFVVNNSRLELHIGISTGPVVGGVLGKKKFIYDLWGDTVNIASRITESAPSGRIWCDELTCSLLGTDFLFSARQQIKLKGRGDASVYELVGYRHLV